MNKTPSTIETISHLICRELAALEREIASYPDDASAWKTPAGISNSAGNLVLHLCGNLRHFIGAVLGKDGYVRDREAEFSSSGIGRPELIEQLARTTEAVRNTFKALSDDALAQPFPNPPGTFRVNTGEFLLHLATHAAYHLGQIDYHRRLVTKDNSTVDTVAVNDLQTIDKS